MYITDQYTHGSRNRVDEIPMHDIAPGYAPIDQRNQRNKPPPGGVAIFPHVSSSYINCHVYNVFEKESSKTMLKYSRTGTIRHHNNINNVYDYEMTRSRGSKFFFMLNSAETKIYPAHKC